MIERGLRSGPRAGCMVRRFEFETGLYYCRYRMGSTEPGRFVLTGYNVFGGGAAVT